MGAIDPTRAEIIQTINQTKARVSGIFNSMSDAGNVYANTYLAANGMAPTNGTSVFNGDAGVIQTNGTSVFNATNSSPQQIYGSFNCSPNGIDTEFVRNYGSYLRDLSARLDANMANMAAQNAAATQAAQAAQSGQTATNVDAPMNFNNSVEPFSKLSDEQIKTLSDKEEEIAKKQDEMKAETDAKKKNEMAKEIKKLQQEYKQLEKDYGANNLSSMFGRNYNFYRNLSPDEISQIREANEEIASMRETIEAKQKERKETWEKIQAKMQEYASKTGQMPTADQIMSPTEKEFFEQSKTEIEDLQKQINTAIDNLHKNTKAASKDKSETYFETENIARANNTSAENKDNSVKTAASTLFDDKGKANSEDNIKKAFGEIEGFDKADKDAVAKFLTEQIDGKSKADFEKYMDTKEFFDAASTSTFVGDNKDNLGLLMAVYDKIKGEGKFKANAEKFGADKSEPARLVAAIKEMEEQKAAEKANEAKDSKPPKAEGTATDVLFDDKNKTNREETIKKSFEQIEGFDKADKDAVAKFLTEQIGDKNKADFEKYMDTKEFFDAASTSTFVGDNKDNLGLLMAVYDKIKGEGQFKANSEKFGADKSAPAKLVAAIKEMEEQKAASKPEGADTTEPAAGTVTPQVEANPDAKAKFDELIKPDDDGKINWESVKAEVDKIASDDSKTNDYKLQLRGLYNQARTQAELAAIVEKYPSTSKDGGKIPYEGFMEEVTKLQGTEHGAAKESKSLIDGAVSTMSFAKAEEILKDLKAEDKLGDNSVATLKQALAEQNISLSDEQIKALCNKYETALPLDDLNAKISNLIANNNGDLSSVSDDQLIDFFEYHNLDGRKTIDEFIKSKKNPEAIRDLAVRLNQIAQKEGIDKRMKYYNPLWRCHSLEAEKGNEITSTTDLEDLCDAAGNVFAERGATTFTLTAYAVCNAIREKRKQ